MGFSPPLSPRGAPTAARLQTRTPSREPSVGGTSEWHSASLVCPAEHFRQYCPAHTPDRRTRGRNPSCDSGVSRSRSPTPRGCAALYEIKADIFVMFGSPGQQCHFWNRFIGYDCECVFLQGALCGEAGKVIPLRVCYDRVFVQDVGTRKVFFLRYDAIEAVRVLRTSMDAERVSLRVPWKEPFQIFLHTSECHRVYHITHHTHQSRRGRDPSCDPRTSRSRSPSPRGFSARYVIVANVFVQFGNPGQQCHFWNRFIGYTCECVYLQGALRGKARKVIPLRVCYDRVRVRDFGIRGASCDRHLFLRYDAIEASRVLGASMESERVPLHVPWKEPFELFVLGKHFRSSAYTPAPTTRCEVIGRRVSRSGTRSPHRRSRGPRPPTIPPPRSVCTQQRTALKPSDSRSLTVVRAYGLPSNIWPHGLVAYQLSYGTDWRVFGAGGETFRWDPADRGSVSESKKSNARELLQKYACEHGINVDGDGFVRIALRIGDFWVSFRGGVAHAAPASVDAWDDSRSRSCSLDASNEPRGRCRIREPAFV